jgi:uncharacterized membrane protein YqjE
MNQFRKAFESGQHAVEKKRTTLLYVVLIFMALTIMVEELVAHRYVLAALAPVFFLVVMPWLGKGWFKARRNDR